MQAVRPAWIPSIWRSSFYSAACRCFFSSWHSPGRKLPLGVGIDGENSAFEAIKNGKLAATFIYPFCAPEGIVYAYKIAKGEQVPERVILKSTRVDASNVDQYLGKGF